MTGDWSGPRRHPPVPVVKAAERAFREQRAPRVGLVTLVFDSFFDLNGSQRVPRLLMFTVDAFDLVLTVSVTPRGNLVGGVVLGGGELVVGIRRPMRATIALRAGTDGVLEQTMVPPGTASILVSAATGESWQSRWLTL